MSESSACNIVSFYLLYPSHIPASSLAGAWVHHPAGPSQTLCLETSLLETGLSTVSTPCLSDTVPLKAKYHLLTVRFRSIRVFLSSAPWL